MAIVLIASVRPSFHACLQEMRLSSILAKAVLESIDGEQAPGDPVKRACSVLYLCLVRGAEQGSDIEKQE